ncbi:MAG: DNA topoisomerase (ATP-hydrolyzing) subunit B [Christensenellaceae bacterium]|nr:DNA topoisomerase (ATP-hydrolyzing) subunit B [Christensenellaceae bacterium]
MSTVKSEYNETKIQVLQGLEAVRKRPGMYIGSTSERGLQHLIVEIVDNSVDEALAGHCDTITVEILKDGSVSVTDNGRGIPTGKHPTEKVSCVEVVLTKLHAGGKFGEGGGYKISGGLHGVGISVVNALSEWLEVEVFQDGKHFKQTYNRGIPQKPLAEIGTSKQRGTKVTFFPDSEIFDTIDFNYDHLRGRLREVAFLNKGLHIISADHRPGRERKDDFCFKGGIVEFVEYLNRNKDLVIPQTIYIHKQNKNNEVEIAFAYNDGYGENINTYANNINTEEGGVHLIGFRNALNKIVNEYGKKLNLLKDADKLSIDDTLEGICAVISVKLMDPQFEGQTKTKLGNSEMRMEVEKAMQQGLTEFLEENPKQLKELINKFIIARNARDAARNAKDLIRRKSVLETTTLPGKLADCTSRKMEECEIYIVEGESAGGTAKQGRDRRFQAILPLRGKILNVEKARLGRVLENAEIKNMITAFGCGIQEDFEINKLRYGKIICMTDADVDGSHIRILLLTFFYRFMKPLVEKGHVYIAQPPLYKVSRGKTETYYYSDADLEKALGNSRSGVTIQRYKGLGEMNAEQLWETTMSPQNRTLLQVSLEDAFMADEIFSTLMGEKPELRRDFIADHAAQYSENLDV